MSFDKVLATFDSGEVKFVYIWFTAENWWVNTYSFSPSLVFCFPPYSSPHLIHDGEICGTVSFTYKDQPQEFPLKISQTPLIEDYMVRCEFTLENLVECMKVVSDKLQEEGDPEGVEMMDRVERYSNYWKRRGKENI